MNENTPKRSLSLPLIYSVLGLIFWLIYQIAYRTLTKGASLIAFNLPLYLLAFVLPIITLIVSRTSAEPGIKKGIKILGLVFAGLQTLLALIFFIMVQNRVNGPYGILYRLPGSHIFLDFLYMLRARSLFLTLAMAFISGVFYVLANASCSLLDVDEKKYVCLYKIGRSGLFSLGAGAVFALFISILSILIYGRVYVFNGYAFTKVLWYLVSFAIMWGVISIPLFFVGQPYYKSHKPAIKNAEAAGDGYIDLVAHVLLCLFTFGIWYLIWVYRTTAYLNRAPGAQTYNPTAKMLLCLFIPFYSIFWFYKHGQRLDTLSKARNIQGSDMATLCLILSIFIPIVACILMQDRINSIAKAEKTA